MTYKELIKELESLKDLGKDIENAEVVFITKKSKYRPIEKASIKIYQRLESIRIIALE